MNDRYEAHHSAGFSGRRVPRHSPGPRFSSQMIGNRVTLRPRARARRIMSRTTASSCVSFGWGRMRLLVTLACDHCTTMDTWVAPRSAISSTIPR